MDKKLGLLVGMVVVLGLLMAPRPSEAVDSCSVSGTYYMSGFALGDTEVVGFAVFTPNGSCTGGSFTSSITIKVDGGAAQNITPGGTYVVNGDTTMSITATGLLTLSGLVSQVANNLANAIHAVGDVGGAVNVGLTMTSTVPAGIPVTLNRDTTVTSVVNTTTPTLVYNFTLPAGSLSGGKVLIGHVLYDYANSTGSNKNLTLEFIFGAAVIASQAITTTSAGFAVGQFNFNLGAVIGSSFENGGFGGEHGDPGGIIALRAVGTSNQNVANPQPVQLRVTHSAASANLSFRKLLVVLELH